MTIHILPDQLASQIAAGEVVERPSSVVKELVENGIDAHANTINIDIRDGGRSSIQIADNGHGIPAADIETAFRRHATSKLQTVDDLNAIRTLGFRGEALAALAAVSQVTLVSRAKGEEAGTRLTLHGGIKISRDAAGAPQGTVILVENLFYNVPARLKFLKSDATERRLIDEFVTRYALAYPHIRFRLSHNGRVTFQSSGNGSTLDVLVAIYGPDVVRQLLPIEPEELPSDADGRAPEVQIGGYVGSPAVHWSNRAHIILFVNGRWVKDNQLTYAIVQAYQSLLPSGRYPLAILFLQLPPEQVDVNVHPAKTEIRFRGDQPPFGLVQRVVRHTLVEASPSGGSWPLGQQVEALNPGWMGQLDGRAFADSQPAAAPLGLSWDASSPDADSAPSAERTAVAGQQLPVMRLVGQVGAAYLITEGPEGLFLIDQQAAHERVLFEQYLAAWQTGQLQVQPLPSGTAVTLSPDQTAWLTAHLPVLAQIGWQVEAFGPQTFMVRAVPVWLAQHDINRLMLALVTRPEAKTVTAEWVMRRLSQAAAYRPGQTLSAAQMSQLIQQLEQCQDPMSNLQGQPTFIYLSVAQLAREFGRF